MQHSTTQHKKMEDKITALSEKFKELKSKALEQGLAEEEIIRQFSSEAGKTTKVPRKGLAKWKLVFLGLVLLILVASSGYYYFGDMFDESSPCIVDNSIFVMEAARRIADCRMCEGLRNVPKLSGLTPEVFVSDFAYSGKPLVVKDATKNWTAIQEFSYEYFRKLYSESETALNSTDEECQFFPYQTEFHTLREVFNMSKERVEFKAEPWYVGW